MTNMEHTKAAVAAADAWSDADNGKHIWSDHDVHERRDDFMDGFMYGQSVTYTPAPDREKLARALYARHPYAPTGGARALQWEELHQNRRNRLLADADALIASPDLFPALPVVYGVRNTYTNRVGHPFAKEDAIRMSQWTGAPDFKPVPPIFEPVERTPASEWRKVDV